MPTPTTANRGYELPHPDNLLDQDVYRLTAALEAIDGDIATMLLDLADQGADILQVLYEALTIAGEKTFLTSPFVPNLPSNDNSHKVANTAFVRTALAALVGSSPAALDTLNELAAALGNDPNFATTVLSQLATKAPVAHSHTMADVTGLSDLLTGLSGLLPSGLGPLPWSLPTLPTGGWVWADGSVLLGTTDYQALRTAYINAGFPWGQDGSGNPKLPDMRGRVGAGKDDMGGTAAGRLSVTLTGTRASTANGNISALSSTANLAIGMKAFGTGIGVGAVITAITSATAITLSVSNVATGTNIIRFGIVDGAILGDAGGAQVHNLVTDQIPSHAHDIGSHVASGGTNGPKLASGTDTAGARTMNTSLIQPEGGGQNHPNVQPTIIVNYIVKT